MDDMKVISLKCVSCGATLQIPSELPQNSTIYCLFCKGYNQLRRSGGAIFLEKKIAETEPDVKNVEKNQARLALPLLVEERQQLKKKLNKPPVSILFYPKAYLISWLIFLGGLIYTVILIVNFDFKRRSEPPEFLTFFIKLTQMFWPSYRLANDISVVIPILEIFLILCVLPAIILKLLGLNRQTPLEKWKTQVQSEIHEIDNKIQEYTALLNDDRRAGRSETRPRQPMLHYYEDPMTSGKKFEKANAQDESTWIELLREREELRLKEQSFKAIGWIWFIISIPIGVFIRSFKIWLAIYFGGALLIIGVFYGGFKIINREGELDKIIKHKKPITDYIPESKKTERGIIMPMKTKSGSIGGAILIMFLLSVLLFWLPIIGPLIAGIVGGKKAGSVGQAILAVCIPAIIFGALIATLATTISGIPLIGAIAGAGSFVLALAHVGPMFIGAIIGGLLA